MVILPVVLPGFLKALQLPSCLYRGSGSSASVFFDQSSTNNHTLSNITINRSSGIGNITTLGNALLIKDLVDVQSGTLASGGFLTMLSAAANTFEYWGN